jgi:hypothetical protein
MTQAASVRPGADPGVSPAAGAPRPTLRTILKLSLAQARPGSGPGEIGGSYAEQAAILAPILAAELAKHGYRIHDTRLCIRVPAGEDGRPMTVEELRALPIGQKIGHPRRRLREPNAEPGTFSE